MALGITEDYFGSLCPAYGRDYKSKAAFEADFRAGKDFELHSGAEMVYCSIRDFKPGVKIQIRYKKLSQTTMIKV